MGLMGLGLRGMMGGIGDGVCVMVGLGWIGSFGRLLLALDFRF